MEQSYRVLIVDDELIERRGIQRLIASMGLPLHVSLAPDGETAWNQICEGLIPEILITDIRMPFLDGLTLASRVHAMYPRTQIIIYTAYDEFEYARQAIGAGVIEYLLKPIDIPGFRDLMERVIKTLDIFMNRTARDAGLRDAFHPPDDIAPATAAGEPDPSPEKPRPERALVRKIKSLIAEEYGTDLSLEAIAGRVGRTPNHISSVFRSETGESIMKYLMKYRMTVAERLLTDTNKRLTEIALLVGYSSPAYFGQVFRGTHGMSPGAYRENPQGGGGA